MSYLDQKYDSTLIRVSSNDRKEDLKHESSESFSANIGVPYMIHGCQVLTAHIPNTFYNISEGTFHFTVTHYSVPFNIHTHVVIQGSIAKGQYSDTELLDAFYTAADTILLTESVNHSWMPRLNRTETKIMDITHKTRITFDSPSSFVNEAAGNSVTIEISKFDDIDNEVLHHLGWRDNINSVNTAAGDYSLVVLAPGLGSLEFTSPYSLDLTGRRIIDVYCPELAATAPGDPPIIAEVPMTQEWGDICFYQAPHDFAFLNEYSNPRYISEISLSLRDEKGRLLDIGNHDWSVLVKIFYSR